MSAVLPTTELDLAKTIALPSRLGERFGREMFGEEWVPFPFLLDAEREVVEACVRRTTQDWFIFNCPNQVGKTSWAGMLLPIWFLGMFPDRQVIFISYSDDYSKRYGRMVRDFFKSYGRQLFGLEIDPDNDSATDWGFKGHSGGMLSKGIGSLLTGRQGDLVVIDDVLKGPKEAASAATKEDHWNEFWGTIYGRRQPGCVYLVTATRLAEDDLGGRFMAQQDQHSDGLDWQRLIYPGICEPPEDYTGKPEAYRDRLGRKVGEPLQCRFSQPSDTIESNWWVEAKTAMKNDALFNCMVQQNPQPGEGGMFPPMLWVFEYRKDWPTLFQRVRAWDLASTRDAGDFSTGTLMGKSVEGRTYICGRERGQWGSLDGLERVKATARSDGPSIPILIEEEKGGAGKTLVAFYAKELDGHTVLAAKPEGTKEQRAQPYSTAQQSQTVVLPLDEADQEWVASWVKEHKGMRGDGRRGPHDDQIDTAAYAFNYLADHAVVRIEDPNEVTPAAIRRQLEMEKYLDLMGL